MKNRSNENYNLLKGRLSIAQLILTHIYSKNYEQETTIDELKEALGLPRSTIIDHLKLLENDGLIERSKDGRTWEFFKPKQEYAKEMEQSLSMLKEAYVHALGYISQRRLKEVEEMKKAQQKKENDNNNNKKPN